MNGKPPGRPGTGRTTDLVVALKGGGDLATGVAVTLYRAGIRRIYIMEADAPTVIRRRASLGTAVYDGNARVEGVDARLVKAPADITRTWAEKAVPVMADPSWQGLSACPPDVLVDAVVAKTNLGTRITDAPLVIGLGPGFTAGTDVHIVIETRRGHDLGRIITDGAAAPNTSCPEAVMGFGKERLVRAPATGTFHPAAAIGDLVEEGGGLGRVDDAPVRAAIRGVVRGLIREGARVTRGQKIGDVDPRGEPRYCSTVSDKARAIGGAVLTAVLGARHDGSGRG